MTDSRGNIVLVDLDNVLTDFDGGVQKVLGAEYPSIPISDSRMNFFISQDYPEHKDLVEAIFRKPGFLRELDVVVGALEGWQRILDLGYMPRICSSPLPGHPESKVEKLDWLDEHFVPIFGGWVVDTAIIDREKYKYDALALVDDRPEVNRPGQASWEHVLYSRPYNLLSPAVYRLEGWQDPKLGSILRAINDQV